MHDFINSHKSPVRQILSGCPPLDEETEIYRGYCNLQRPQLIKWQSRDLNQFRGNSNARLLIIIHLQGYCKN